MLYSVKKLNNLVFLNLTRIPFEKLVMEFSDNCLGTSIETVMTNDIHNWHGCALAVTGTFSFSSYTDEKLRGLIDELSKQLQKSNSKIFILRGCGDGIRYFTEEHPFDTENVIFLEDYSVIEAKDNTYLCIGGGLSLERDWLISQGSYDPSELPIFDEEKTLSSIRKHKVNALFTHSVPAFLRNFRFFSENTWFEDNDELLADYLRVLESMNKIFMCFVQTRRPLYIWICGGNNDQGQRVPFAYGLNGIFPILPYFDREVDERPKIKMVEAPVFDHPIEYIDNIHNHLDVDMEMGATLDYLALDNAFN